MAPVIIRSKLAPVTCSLRSPLPVSVVFCPRVMVEGEKDVIFVLVPAPPQSFQVNAKSLAAAVDARRATTVDFMVARTSRNNVERRKKKGGVRRGEGGRREGRGVSSHTRLGLAVGNVAV